MGDTQETVKIGAEARQPAQDGWKTLAVFLIGFLIGMGSAWLSFRNQETSPSASSAVTAQQSAEKQKTKTASDDSVVSAGEIPGGTAVASNFINAHMQLAGSVATVQSVSLETSGWLVVYEDRLGQPGNALGATRLDAGTYEDIHVELLRNTVPAEIYDIVLHKDNGDRIFNLEDDFPFRDSGGNPIMVKFRTADGSASN